MICASAAKLKSNKVPTTTENRSEIMNGSSPEIGSYPSDGFQAKESIAEVCLPEMGMLR